MHWVHKPGKVSREVTAEDAVSVVVVVEIAVAVIFAILRLIH